MTKKIALVLAGCGHLDGSEIREAVISLLELDKRGAHVTIFAPNKNQHHVVNHLTGQEIKGETRNIMVEAARIARGKLKDLKEARAKDFDALILPGGYGVAKNLCDLAFKGKDATVLAEFKSLILEFLKAKKPVGAICISPAVLVAAAKGEYRVKVTIGDDEEGLINSLGGEHSLCATENITIDEKNKVISCSAYMRDDSLSKIAQGISKLIEKTLQM